MDRNAKIRRLDISMALVSLAAVLVGATMLSGWPTAVFVLLFGFSFLICAARSLKRVPVGTPVRSLRPDRIRLLGEDGKILCEWDISQMVSAVIGKSNAEEVTDIDLSESIFSGTIENVHAILNRVAGNRYLEDVSEAGVVSLEREGLSYRLSKSEPCILSPGDIIRISEARLLFG